ncbi:MAG: thiamine phosphate synthase [Sphingomonas sp.]|uniref:thiamine phosphate synthase n=1 Tax=Sphingomonas sp. TaxID=28214 RepID=UPI00122119CA|nr:thiamine phosphate synthase [Sphingomonas sp.]THD35954.1 MAG: thiamine phosphate synthase [Sphingomonas sp.]
MTDERQGDELWAALRRLPRGSGVVFRHYATPAAERQALFARVMRVARARALVVVRAGAWCGVGADGVHNGRGVGLRTASAHSWGEAKAAVRRGVDMVFVSPVFATRSHPGGTVLGVKAAEKIARRLRVPAIALGGMDAARFRPLRAFYGWAAIDAWTATVESPPRQSRVVGPRSRDAGRTSC